MLVDQIASLAHYGHRFIVAHVIAMLLFMFIYRHIVIHTSVVLSVCVMFKEVIVDAEIILNPFCHTFCVMICCSHRKVRLHYYWLYETIT